MINGKLGNEPLDISNIWVLVEDKTKPNNWDAVYVKNNKGEISVIKKPDNMDYSEFKKKIWAEMQAIGIKKDVGRGTTWAIYSRENNKVDFNAMDNAIAASQNTNAAKQTPAVVNQYKTAVVARAAQNEKSDEEKSIEASIRKLREIHESMEKERENQAEQPTKNANGEGLTNKNIDQKVIKSQFTRTYKIKSISSIFSSTKKPLFKLGTSGIAAGAFFIASAAAFSLSAPTIVGATLAGIGVIKLEKSLNNLFDIKFRKIKEDSKSYFSERFNALKEDINDFISIKKEEAKDGMIDEALNNIEHPGRRF